jgi:class 3 adenylate cyclase
MPMYLDRHDAPGVTPDQLAQAHLQDLEVQDRYNVKYLSYWFDPSVGSVFCLAEGPNPEALTAVHREAHGLEASAIIEVEHRTLQAFMGPPPAHPPGEGYVAPGVRAILFTDICNSTAMTQRLGDAGAMAVLREHDKLVRSALETHGGREVKHMGDGIMASFSSVAASVDGALAIQDALRSRNQGAEVPIDLRIGIAAGEPVTDNEDLFGAAVQLAARLCTAAPPGGVVVSVAVRELCIGKAFRFEGVGPLELKGFAGPTPAFAVSF